MIRVGEHSVKICGDGNVEISEPPYRGCSRICIQAADLEDVVQLLNEAVRVRNAVQGKIKLRGKEAL